MEFLKLIRFNELRFLCAGVAQLAEQLICNQQVVGSIPIASSIKMHFYYEGSDVYIVVRYPSGQRDQTVNLAAHAFEGSNPSLSTIRFV